MCQSIVIFINHFSIFISLIKETLFTIFTFLIFFVYLCNPKKKTEIP